MPRIKIIRWKRKRREKRHLETNSGSVFEFLWEIGKFKIKILQKKRKKKKEERKREREREKKKKRE